MTSTLMKAESALAKSEHELSEAMQAAFESFYSQGVILERILMDKEFKDAGFESFADYMNERQPCGIQMRQAYRLIQATEVRKLLPVLSDSDNGIWSEWTIRPLLHKDFSPNDQRRIGKKIATRVKNGEKLTAALVKSICDDERGVERRKAEKQSQEVAATPTAFVIVDQKWGEALLWLKTFKEVPASFWSDAESDEPGCVEKLSETYSKLAAFLATKKPR